MNKTGKYKRYFYNLIIWFCVFTAAAVWGLIFPEQNKANTVLTYDTVYTLPTDTLTNWTAIYGSVNELSDVLRSSGKVITVKPQKSGFGSIGTTHKLAFDWSDISEKDSSVAVQFLLYINDVNFMKDADGNFMGGTVSFFGGMASCRWDIAGLKLKNGWNRILLNFRTADGFLPQDNGFGFKDLTTFKIEINKPQNVTELVIGLDAVEIATLSVSEGKEPPAPENIEYDKNAYIIAFSVAGAVVVLVFAEAIRFSIKEKRRLRRLKAKRRRKRLAEQNKGISNTEKEADKNE